MIATLKRSLTWTNIALGFSDLWEMKWRLV
jgi:hypothetical protein